MLIGAGVLAGMGAIAAVAAAGGNKSSAPALRNVLGGEGAVHGAPVPAADDGTYPAPGRARTRPSWPAPLPGRLSPDEWLPAVIRSTTAHESGGNFSAAQESLDGQGLSFGLIQWTQLGGGLGVLLAAMRIVNPRLFDATFGGAAAAAALLATTAQASLAPVAGAVLWAEPWIGRFRQAGTIQAFQDVQLDMAAHGDHMKLAVELAQISGIHTERAMGLFYNRAVHQLYGARTALRRYLASMEAGASWPVSPIHMLGEYGWFCASRFRRTTAPANTRFGDTIVWAPYTSSYDTAQGKPWAPPNAERDLEPLAGGQVHEVWRPVAPGTHWHALSGGKLYFDLWDLIIKRTAEVLTGRTNDGRIVALRDVNCDLGDPLRS